VTTLTLPGQQCVFVNVTWRDLDQSRAGILRWGITIELDADWNKMNTFRDHDDNADNDSMPNSSGKPTGNADDGRWAAVRTPQQKLVSHHVRLILFLFE